MTCQSTTPNASPAGWTTSVTFSFARAIAEFIPFKEGQFTDVVVVSALKPVTHWLKDTLEDRATRAAERPAPHHMHEFTPSSFLDSVSAWFTIVNQARYSRNWYSPDKLFITLARRP